MHIYFLWLILLLAVKARCYFQYEKPARHSTCLLFLTVIFLLDSGFEPCRLSNFTFFLFSICAPIFLPPFPRPTPGVYLSIWFLAEKNLFSSKPRALLVQENMETIVSLAIQVALIFPAAPYYPNSPCFVYESQTVTQGRDCTRVFQDGFLKPLLSVSTNTTCKRSSILLPI